jgi:flagellar hook-length control protein FliK
MVKQLGTVIAFSGLETMEPILLLPTVSQNVTASKAPGTPAPSEGTFQDLLKGYPSLTKEIEFGQDSSVADPMITSILLSMLQVPLDPTTVVSSEVLGGEPEKTTVPTLGLSNPFDPLDPLTQEFRATLTQINEKNLAFPGEFVIRDGKGESPVVTTQPVVNPQNEAAGTSVAPGASSVPEMPAETLPSNQDSAAPLPASFSDKIRGILTEGTHSQQSLEASEPPLMKTTNTDSGTKPSGLIDPTHISYAKNETDPTGQEKLKELLNTPFRGGNRPVDSDPKNVVGNRPEETIGQGLERDRATRSDPLPFKSLQEGSPAAETGARASNGETAISPFVEELTGSVKTTAEAVDKDGDVPFLKKEVENGSESSLILKPEGNQAASSPREVTKPHQPAAPRTEAPDILQQVSKKLVWSVKSGEEKIKLQLEPPQLGSLYIEIGRQKDVLQATVWTNNQVTKELLESHQLELQRILKEDGFHLGQFDVFVNPQMKSFQERMEGHMEQGQRNHASHEPRGSLSRSESDGAPLPVTSWMRGSHRIDFFI